MASGLFDADSPTLWSSRFGPVKTSETVTMDTWTESETLRKLYPDVACLYGANRALKNSTPRDEKIMVLEMHNERNEIMGVGLLAGTEEAHRSDAAALYYKKRLPYFACHVYRGIRRIDRSEMCADDLAVVEILEDLLFRGKRHSKLLAGITELPPHFFTEINFVLLFQRMFEEKEETLIKANVP